MQSKNIPIPETKLSRANSSSPNPVFHRNWLAALLLRQPEPFLARLTTGLIRLGGVPRGLRRRLKRRWATAALGAALLLGAVAGAARPPAAYAATIIVDGVTCSLIDAITAANSDTATNGCVAGDPGLDTIDLQTDVTLTASLVDFYGNTGTPVVSTEIVIQGNGHTIARDPNDPDLFRLLAVDLTGDLTLHDVTLSGGRTPNYLDGGGVLVIEGTLRVYDSALTGNFAGNYGGGIANSYGTATISRTHFNDNYAGDEGGGVSLYHGTMTIADSTFTGNTAADDGGAIVNYYGTMSITNSTLSGNSAFSGGAIYNDDDLTITNSTLTGNSAFEGGGIVNIGSLTLSRTIVSGNTSNYSSVAEIRNGTTITADDHNVFGHAGLDNSGAFLYFTPSGSDVNATSDGANIALSDILDTTLADNGGPTLTHNLVPGSPALDMAPDADCAAAPVNGLDQRGFARPFDVPGEGNDGADTCDAGAVEYASPSAETDIFLSANSAGTTGDGLAFGPHDVLRYDGIGWTKFFDGSAAHLMPNGKAKHNVNAIWVPDPNGEDVVMSFGQNARHVPDITPKVDGMDLVWWDGTSFSLWFDGNDVDLTNKTQEKIDALHVLPGGGPCLYNLLISTQGPGRVSNAGEPAIIFSGEDVLGFCATNLGDNTDGVWSLVLDGSDQAMPRNSTTSISVSDDGNTLYLTTRSTFNVDAATGGHSMVYAYDFGTETFSGPLFIAADEGLPRHVDGLHVVGLTE